MTEISSIVTSVGTDEAGAAGTGTTSGTGTVTSVGSGTGLTGGPITGSGSLALASSYQLPQSCANGQVASSNGAGGWTANLDVLTMGVIRLPIASTLRARSFEELRAKEARVERARLRP